MQAPTITTPRKTAGVAGQFSIKTTVTYPGEAPAVYEFVGSTYGGPIVMVSPTGAQTFVREPGRFGPELTPAWVEAFFATS